MEGKWVELKGQKGVYGFVLSSYAGFDGACKLHIIDNGKDMGEKKVHSRNFHLVDKLTLTERDRKILRDQQINLALAVNDREWLMELSQEMEGSK